jgi:uncharacterized membrane protein YeaQ/YmgE (transglycosylase-associated protein family)
MTMFWVYVFFVGLAAGWMAGQIIRRKGVGLIGNLLVGIIGSFIGGIIFRILWIGTIGVLGAVVSAFLGAVVFLWLVNLLKK